MYTVSFEQKMSEYNNDIHPEDEEIVPMTEPFNYDVPSPILIKTEKDSKTGFENYNQHPLVTTDSEYITSSDLNLTVHDESVNEEIYFMSVENEATRNIVVAKNARDISALDPLSYSDASVDQEFTSIVANESLGDTVKSLSSKNKGFDHENHHQPGSNNSINKKDPKTEHKVIDLDDRIWFSSEIVGDIPNMHKHGIATPETNVKYSREDVLSGPYLFKRANTFRCIFCKDVFARESLYFEHISHCIQNTDRCACRMCGSAYKNIDELIKHKKEHMYEDPLTKMVWFRCQECHSRFNTENGIIKHFKEAFPNNHTFKCRYCNSRFINYSDLENHSKSHPRIKWCQCCLCEKKYSTTPSLRVHLECAHGLPTEWVMNEIIRIENVFSHTESSADVFKSRKLNRFQCMVCKTGKLTAGYAVRHARASFRCSRALFRCTCGGLNIELNSLREHNHGYESMERPEWCKNFLKKVEQ